MEPHVKENSSCGSNGGKNGEVGDDDEDDGSCEEEEVTKLPIVASAVTCDQSWNFPPSGESDLDVGGGGGCSGGKSKSGARGRLDVVGNCVQLRRDRQ